MECVLRQWRPEDAGDLAETINNPNILNNLRDGIPYPYSVKDAEEFIGAMLAADPANNFAFAITVDDRAVGSISISRCANIHSRTAELGYYLGEAYWGKGLCTSAVRQACRHVFDNTDIIRIFAEHFSYNTASCRVLEKAGFLCEGILRKNACKNGRILDMKMYACIKQED